MKKPDELELLKLVLAGYWPRIAGRELGIHWKRVQRLCEKWQRKQWYSCGVTIDIGWLEDAGKEAISKLLAPPPWPCSICGLGKVGHILSDEAGLICPSDVVRPTE